MLRANYQPAFPIGKIGSILHLRERAWIELLGRLDRAFGAIRAPKARAPVLNRLYRHAVRSEHPFVQLQRGDRIEGPRIAGAGPLSGGVGGKAFQRLTRHAEFSQ